MRLPDRGVVRVRRRVIAVATVLCLLLAGCGGGDDGGDGGDDGVTPTPSETVQPTPQGEQVGRVLSVLESLARVQGERVAEGDPIFQGSEVTTDERGRATFNVQDILEDCQIQSESRLTVAPGPRNPLRVEQGSVLCRSKPGIEEFRIEAGQAEVSFQDPIFQLEVAQSQTDVRVDFGFVQVKKPGQDAARLVGPASEFTVGRQSIREDRARRFQMDSLGPFDVEALNRMRAALPEEVRGFPSAANSRTLSLVRSQRALRVGFDDTASGESEDFVDELAGLVADRWGVGSDAEALDREDATRTLAEGRLDAYVSPERVSGAAQIPLFGDEDERTWFLMVRPDAGFQSALEGALKTVLDNGDYADAYAGSFGRLPTYEAVRSLVFPTPQQAGRSRWRQPEEIPESPTAEAKIRQVSLAASPAKFEGECPVEITFAAKVVVDTPGEVEVEYLRNDGTIAGREKLRFEKRGTYELKNRPVLQVDQSRSGWWILVVPDQGVQSEKAAYSVTCEQAPVID